MPLTTLTVMLQEGADSMVTSITDLGQRWLHLDPGVQISLVKSLVLILIIILVRSIVLGIMRARVSDIRSHHSWRKTITYFSVVIGALAVGRIWFSGLSDIATFLGLVTAGVAIALKDPIVNLGGWLFILWRRPFVLGDRIQIGEHSGDVIDQGLFQIIMLEIGNWVDADQSTGRLINIPNAAIFREPLANYTRGMQFIWNEITVLITFDSDWKKAKQVLLEIVEAHSTETVQEAEQQMLKASRQYMIFYSTLTPTVYTSVRESGVALTMRYLCHPRRRRGSAHALWEDVLTRFAEHDDVELAYPTIHTYFTPVGGVPAIQPPA